MSKKILRNKSKDLPYHVISEDCKRIYKEQLSPSRSKRSVSPVLPALPVTDNSSPHFMGTTHKER
jgi:hypothetical protein